ncbi:PSME3-interacting protein isoform X2 [Periplaneta americana]|uniref:PSME3-interacting protein isoform X2 n=1 Tax=Periplaneta americana TaxID=6978 RepID=UPI0037E7A1AC
MGHFCFYHLATLLVCYNVDKETGTMSSGFISEAELAEQRRIRQEEWEKVRKPGQPEENMIKGLDDDEVEFLDLVDRSKLEEERRKSAEEAREIKDFRNAVATLQERSLEQRIHTEIRARPPAQTSISSGRSSQVRLLAGAVVRKRPSETPAQASGDKKPRSAEEDGEADTKNSEEDASKKRKDRDEEVQNGDSGAMGLRCIGILPGLGLYPDSSDSEQSSDTDQELASSGYDLLGRKITRQAKSKSTTSSSR